MTAVPSLREFIRRRRQAPGLAFVPTSHPLENLGVLPSLDRQSVPAPRELEVVQLYQPEVFASHVRQLPFRQAKL